MFDPRPSRANPEHRAARKELEKASGYDNLKSMGLKAGVLAMMAGLALYPKISAEAGVIEREMKMKEDKKIAFRRRERRRREDERDRQDARDRERERERERGERRRRDSWGGERGLVRVDEYDMRRGEGVVRYQDRNDRSQRRSLADDERMRDNRRWEQASTRSAGNDRTREWVHGGYEYLSGNDYRERDRRRW